MRSRALAEQQSGQRTRGDRGGEAHAVHAEQRREAARAVSRAAM